jgi:hypothetical protein
MVAAGLSETSVSFYHETKLRHTFTVTALSISNIKDRDSSLNQAITASFYIPSNPSFTIIQSIDATKSALNEVQVNTGHISAKLIWKGVRQPARGNESSYCPRILTWRRLSEGGFTHTMPFR